MVSKAKSEFETPRTLQSVGLDRSLDTRPVKRESLADGECVESDLLHHRRVQMLNDNLLQGGEKHISRKQALQVLG